MTLLTANKIPNDWNYYKGFCREDPGLKASLNEKVFWGATITPCKCLLTDDFLSLIKTVPEILKQKLCPSVLVSSKACKTLVSLLIFIAI